MEFWRDCFQQIQWKQTWAVALQQSVMVCCFSISFFYFDVLSPIVFSVLTSYSRFPAFFCPISSTCDSLLVLPLIGLTCVRLPSCIKSTRLPQRLGALRHTGTKYSKFIQPLHWFWPGESHFLRPVFEKMKALVGWCQCWEDVLPFLQGRTRPAVRQSFMGRGRLWQWSPPCIPLKNLAC